MAHIVMKKWHPKYFHFLKLCVLLSDDIFLFVFQVDSDFFRALFSSFCRKKLPTSKAHLKAQTSNFFSFSTAHVDLTSEMFEPPKISGHVRTCEKVDTSSFNMVIFYIPICSQLRPGLPTVIGGRVEEQDRCL